MPYSLRRAARNTWLDVRELVSPLSMETLKGRYFEMEDEFLALWQRCAPSTMTTIERGYGLWQSIRYLSRANIEGDFVECGVWKGGSSMLAALTARQCGLSPEIYLYDTFEGMTAPVAADATAREGTDAALPFRRHRQRGDNWLKQPLDTVRANMASTGYPSERVHFIKGPVEQTLPDSKHERIALLRLDTDFYESTRAELEHLYPRLVPGGVLILDDYGHWQGARQAVDEYIDQQGLAVLMHRIDYACRVITKPGG